MNKPRKPPSARSQGAVRTPTRLKPPRSLSVTSQRSNSSGILSDLHTTNMESFVLSPLVRKSVLTDNTEIEGPRQSSSSESINSIVIPQRKLIAQKENLPMKKSGEIIGTRETLARLHKPNTVKTINTKRKKIFTNFIESESEDEIFEIQPKFFGFQKKLEARRRGSSSSHGIREPSRTSSITTDIDMDDWKLLPSSTMVEHQLEISPDKTADKTKEFTAVEPKSQVRNKVANRFTKRKKIFTNFFESESEGEISEIQPKFFGFQKKLEVRRRGSSSSHGIREPSRTSSITTDIDMDDWKLLPSSTMVEHQLEISPDKTADKTKEFTAVEPKSQVRNKVANRFTKRKKIFTNFIESESEGEISEIQPKFFGFQKKLEARRRGSSSSHGIREPSRTSSITTDIDMDDWKLLPSSTMVEHQLEILMTGQTIDKHAYINSEAIPATAEQAHDEENESEDENQEEIEYVADSDENDSEPDSNSNEGSGWDSHRKTRKTLRQTYGREFTTRKSLRALVMEKSAKRRTQQNEIASATAEQANDEELNFTLQHENEEEDLEQHESQEVEDENEEEYQEKNTSSEEIEQGTDMEQNESGIRDTEENESEDENQEESESVADSDENDSEPDNIQEDTNDSDNQDKESGQDENQEVDEVIETPNVSHDTTGRNRKKNESPEAIPYDSYNLPDSFVRGCNTSIMKTKMMQTMNIQPILSPVRESTGFLDGNSNEGSGWDSHRKTRKKLSQTYGREFTSRKSLRALVMEKSAERRTQQTEIASATAPFPQANSTEMPDTSNRYNDENEVEENQETNHEVSRRTQMKTLKTYFQEVRKKNAERRRRIEEELRNSLKDAPPKYIWRPKMPAKPRRTKPPPKPKQNNGTYKNIFGELPEDIIEDMKYKPPKRFQPAFVPWITKDLYKYLETKLEPKYSYKARIRAEKLVESIYKFTRYLRRREVASPDAVSVLKREMARLNVVKTHFEFNEFFHQFMPIEVREKVIPDALNNISLPRDGVFADIL